MTDWDYAVLNTSLNFHGSPIVTPHEALDSSSDRTERLIVGDNIIVRVGGVEFLLVAIRQPKVKFGIDVRDRSGGISWS